jgi:thiol-disulfide isomerase/thioredoxin
MKRVRTLIFTVTGLGAAALVAGGLYSWYGTNAPEQGAGSPATVARPGKLFSFSPLNTLMPVPELNFVDGAGREMTLDAFKGQTVLLNIWATWCVPCREEMPALDRLQARLGGPDFRVVPLSIDREGLPKVKAFYEELGLKTLGIYVDRTGKAARQLGAVGIPVTLLVDREGREIGRTVGPAEWDSDEIVRIIEPYVKAAARPEGER